MTTLPIEMMGDVSVKVHWADIGDLKEELKGKFIENPPKATRSAPDPRVMAGSKWRDHVRQLYAFEYTTAQLLLNSVPLV